MRKRIAGFVLTTALSVGAVGPFTATPAHADPDPVLCFVAAQAILGEALHEFQEGHLTAAELRLVLVGTASFLGDCLEPVDSTPPPPDVPHVDLPGVPDFTPPSFPAFPTIDVPHIHLPGGGDFFPV